jgi:hypothetical protein
VFRRDPRRPVVVVDERTYRFAEWAAGELLSSDDFSDWVKAKFAITAITLWLRTEVRTGRRSRRAERAARLERWEAALEPLNERLGLGELNTPDPGPASA